MAAPALVQTSTRTSATSVTSIANSLGSLPAAGNFVLVLVHKYTSLHQFAAGDVTDNQGNTYILAAQGVSVSSPQCAIYYCANIGSPSGTFTITVQFGESANGHLIAQEWANMGTDPALHVASNAGTGTALSSGTTVSVTPPVDGALVVSIAAIIQAATLTVETVSPAWTEVDEVTTPFSAPAGESDYRIVTAAGTQSCAWTSTVSGAWGAAIAVFAPTAALARGCSVFGTNTTIAGATRAAAFGLNGNTNVMTESGKLKVFGKFEVTDTCTVPSPSNSTDAATKGYVDSLAANLGKRQRVRAATTANITISTALNNTDTLDGVALVTGDLVLVKNQTAPAENGIYVVGVSPARFAEFDSYDEHPGSLIVVEEGTSNADTLWLCTSNVGGTLNTTAIAFSQISFSGSGDVVGPSSSVDSEIALFDSTTGKLLKRATGTGVVRAASGVYSASKLKRTFCMFIGDGTNTISTGVQGFFSCPITGTITKVRLLSSDAAVTSGSIVIDIWKDTYANYPPTVADTITASAKPTITTATKSEDSTLTGWTTAVTAGDIFGLNVDSVTSIKRVSLELTIDE